MNPRNYSLLDRVLIQADQKIQYLFGQPHAISRPNPADEYAERPLSEKQREKSGALMRVNHTGEVCAQAQSSGVLRRCHQYQQS